MNNRGDVKELIPQNLAIVQYGDAGAVDPKSDHNARSDTGPMQLQYFKTSTAQHQGMTYRVVHINTTSGGGGEVIQSGQNGTAGAPQTAQILTQAPAPAAAEVQPAAQMAYIQSTTGAEPTDLATLNAAGTGAFYVISSNPADVTLAGTTTRTTPGRCETHRDDRRRATHNEVERRRRDKINNWITKLGKLLPDNGDTGRPNHSKGAVLSQACDYVQDTRGIQQKYMELVRDNEKLLEDIKMLKQSNEALVTANQLLKAHLKSQGAVILEAAEKESAVLPH